MERHRELVIAHPKVCVHESIDLASRGCVVDTAAARVLGLAVRDIEALRQPPGEEPRSATVSVPSASISHDQEIELDLMRAGALPDLYFGDQIRAAWKLEDGDWWFTREFVVDAEARLDDWVLRFEGIDTFAEVFLNDVSLGQADNMLIAHEFPAASLRHGVSASPDRASSPWAARFWDSFP